MVVALEHYVFTEGKIPRTPYWAILERNGRRSINFLISAHKSIPEVAGPAFYDCPEYFFELVPEEDPMCESKCEIIGDN